MSKLQFIFRPTSTIGLEAFSELIQGTLIPTLLGAGPAQIKVTHTGPRPPRLSVIPFRRDPVALISLWPFAVEGGEGEGLEAEPWIRALAPLAGALTGYWVEESTPVAYHRTWADGAPTPGIGLMTFFKRRPGLDDATFLQRWHGGHTPLSLEIHPLWSYIRNVVREPVHTIAREPVHIIARGPAVISEPAWEGLVEEHFQRPDDLLNPLRFFGGPLRMAFNMARVARDVAGFLDMRTLQSYLVQELFVRSR